MSIFEQLQTIFEQNRATEEAQRAERVIQQSEQLYAALTALGFDPGYIENGVYTDHNTQTVIELESFSERTTGRGDVLTFALRVWAIVPEQYRDNSPSLTGEHTFTIASYQEPEDRTIHQLLLHHLLADVIRRRDRWVTAQQTTADPQDEAGAELSAALAVLAKHLKPHLGL